MSPTVVLHIVALVILTAAYTVLTALGHDASVILGADLGVLGAAGVSVAAVPASKAP